MKYRFWAIGFIALFLIVITPVTVRGNSLTHLDAVLVLDASGSMREADPLRLSYEAMKMFVDMLPVAGDRVGIVAYTDEIIASRELTLIQEHTDKIDLKDFIANIPVGGFTDITLGLLEAVRLIEERPVYSENRPVIILFTDGNNHLSPWNPRTQEDLDNDTERIIAYAQDRGIPIYSIGLNFDGTLYHDYIQRFSDETGAFSFETTQPENLLPIMSLIFYSQMDARTILAGGGIFLDNPWEQELEIPEGTHEVNINFLSRAPIEVELLDPLGRPIPFDGHWAIFTQGANYSVLKAIAPAPGEWTIRTIGQSGFEIDMRAMLLSPDWAEPEPVIEDVPEDIPEEEAEPIPSPTPLPSPEPPMPAPEEPEQDYNQEPLINLVVIAIGGGAVFIVLAAALLFRKFMAKRARVFTGRLVIEVIDHYAKEKSAPQYRNLIEYGRRVDLLTLLRGQGSSVLADISIIPSPTAPSHLPQIIVRSANKDLKFKKDFLDQDASKGIEMSMRSEIRIEIPSENKSVTLRYTE